jgi:hypothetical protein
MAVLGLILLITSYEDVQLLFYYVEILAERFNYIDSPTRVGYFLLDLYIGVQTIPFNVGVH